MRKPVTRRNALRLAGTAIGAAAGSGAITGFPTIWAQTIKDITLRQFGTGTSNLNAIAEQVKKDLGFTLQFSTLFNFRTAGMAMEKGLRKFLKSGIDALADLQIEEDEAAGGSPTTKMHQKFAGMNRWLILEQVLSGEK